MNKIKKYFEKRRLSNYFSAKTEQLRVDLRDKRINKETFDKEMRKCFDELSDCCMKLGA